MRILSLLRRRRRQRLNWRTAQRICTVITALIRADAEQHTVEQIAALTNQPVNTTAELLSWMERMHLAVSYLPEPVLPGVRLDRLYFLTDEAYKWAVTAMLDRPVPHTTPGD